MKEQILYRSTDDDIELAGGLVIAPGIAIVEVEDGCQLIHLRSGCTVTQRAYANPEEAAHVFWHHLAEFDWTRRGSEIAADLAVLVALRGAHPRARLTEREFAYFVDIEEIK